MVQHLHISKLEQLQASSDVWAATLITRNAIFFNDVCLRHHGELRAYKLRENHLPTFLAELGGYEVIKFGNVIEYLELAQSKDAAWTVHELFPDHYWQQDFVEVPIAHDTWQPKIDVLQAQIDDLDSTYATDAQVVASFADQIAAAGDVFNLVDTKVGEEKTRAEAAELTLTQAVASEASTARANEVAIEDFFEGTNAQMDSDRDQIKLDFASGDATIAASVVTEKNRALAAEGINTGLVSAEASTARAAESVLTSAVSTEASTARANEAAIELFFEGTDASALSDRNQIKLDFASADAINAVAVVTQKNRIDAILNLSDEDLNTFKEIEDAYKLADGSVETTVTNLVNARVTITTYDTEQDAQDLLILNNTGKITYSDAVLVASHTVDIDANTTAVSDEATTARAAEGVLTTAVSAEASTARAAESVLTSAVSTEASTARANEAAIELFFEGTDASALADRDQIKLDFASGDATNAAAVVTEKVRAEAAESVLTTAVSAEASTARAAESANASNVLLKQNILTVSEQAVVDAHAYNTTEKDKVAANVLKNSYNDSVLVASHVVDIAANTTALGLKHPALSTTSLFHDQINHRLGVGLTAPTSMVHVHDTGGLAEVKVSRNLSDRHVTMTADSFTKYGNGAGSTAWRIRQVTADPIWIETGNAKAIVIDPNCNVTLKQNLTVEGASKLKFGQTPAFNDVGEIGQIQFDNNYIYVCTTGGTWKRAAIGAWS